MIENYILNLFTILINSSCHADPSGTKTGAMLITCNCWNEDISRTLAWRCVVENAKTHLKCRCTLRTGFRFLCLENSWISIKMVIRLTSVTYFLSPWFSNFTQKPSRARVCLVFFRLYRHEMMHRFFWKICMNNIPRFLCALRWYSNPSIEHLDITNETKQMKLLCGWKSIEEYSLFIYEWKCSG